MKAQSKIARSNAPESTETGPVGQQPSLQADAGESFFQSRLGYSLASVPTFATSGSVAKSSPGNAAYKTGPRLKLQAKLMVGAVNDPLEMEADRVADQVMRMPEPHMSSQPDHTKPAGAPHGTHAGGALQRKCDCGGRCDDCQKKHEDQPVKVQMKANGAGTAYGMEAPSIVHEVLRSPGKPLDSATRAFMEPRFGHDFSNVRIHNDAKAAESAKAVGARAYTVGNSVVFGSGEYGPRSTAGQNLLGHELAHVVQQAGGHGRAVQLKPIPTWAGEFEAPMYGALKPKRDPDCDRDAYGAACDNDVYGLGIRLKFTPGKQVDADKIALFQSARSLIDGKPQVSYGGKKAEEITKGRWTQPVKKDKDHPKDDPGGHHIDAWPYEESPVTGMTSSKGATQMSDSHPGTTYKDKDSDDPDAGVCDGWIRFGSRSKGIKPVEARMCDTPSLPLSASQSASQEFETAAVAVEGAQKGTHYGSVSWGWDKGPKDRAPKLRDLTPVSKDVPSPLLEQVIELWNPSKTSAGNQVFHIPIGKRQVTNEKSIKLMDNPDAPKPESVAELGLNTSVEVVEATPLKTAGWVRVVAIDGKFAGKAGWVKSGSLSDSKGDTEKSKTTQKK